LSRIFLFKKKTEQKFFSINLHCFFPNKTFLRWKIRDEYDLSTISSIDHSLYLFIRDDSTTPYTTKSQQCQTNFNSKYGISSTDCTNTIPKNEFSEIADKTLVVYLRLEIATNIYEYSEQLTVTVKKKVIWLFFFYSNQTHN
jgi:hypothetical protein